MGEKCKELYSKAQTAFASGEYENAIAYARAAYTLEPGAVGAYVIAGNACFLLERFVEAEKFFRKALELNPQDGENSFLLGNAMFAQERFKEAMSWYANADGLGCSEASKQKIYYVMGMINQLEGKYQDALVNYDKTNSIPRLSEDQMDILLNKVEIYKNIGELEQAESAALQLKLLLPSEFKSYQLLFQLQLEQRKFNQAKATLKEAEKFCPNVIENRVEIQFDYAMIYCFQAETYPEKKADYYKLALNSLQSLEREPEIPVDVKYEILVTKAEIYMKTNQEQEAIVIADKIALLEQEDLGEYIDRCQFMLMQYYAKHKDYEKIQKYAQLLKNSKDLFHRHLGYYAEANAVCQLARNDSSLQKKCDRLYEVMVAYYKNCTVSNPGDYIAYLYRAMAYVDMGEYKRAEEIGRVLPADGRKKLEEHINLIRNGGGKE